MMIVRTAAELHAALARPREAGRAGFVPTMGALHGGHLALVRAARAECRQVIASVFVNPTQFNDPADLVAYPRDEARDARLAEGAGVDVLFIPSSDEIYPPGHATSIDVKGPAQGYEGARRPGHFSGVATVCVKLFHLVRPDVAYFGQKDAQQAAVITQVVRDLNVSVAIAVVPTVRDVDGVALSSRNVRLSPEERARAGAIPRALKAAVAAHRAGADPVGAARAALTGLEVEYVERAAFGGRETLLVAVRAGAIRLIDNVPLDHPELAGL
jgi:pantoate--beta-alanine ligase